MRLPREKDIERTLTRYCRSRGLLAYKFISPGNDGVPDRLILGPGGRVLFLELKRPGNKPTELQLYQMGRIKALGHVAEWRDNLADMKALVDQYFPTEALDDVV